MEYALGRRLLGTDVSKRAALYAAIDWCACKTRYDAGEHDLYGGSVADRVISIVEAVLARFIHPGEEIADCLTVLPALARSSRVRRIRARALAAARVLKPDPSDNHRGGWHE